MRAATLLLFLQISSSLCFFQAGSIIRDLEATTQAEFSQDTLAWADSFGNTGIAMDKDCDSIYLLDGTNYPYARIYDTLPTHQSIALSAEIYIIDAVGGEVPSFELQGASAGAFQVNDPSAITTNFCGSETISDVGPITYFTVFPHTDPTLQFVLQFASGWGIRNIKILLLTNDISTTDTEFGCVVADPIVDIACGCPLGQYFDGSSCEDCDEACENCMDAGSSNCYSCKDGYYFDGINCLICNDPCDTCYGADADTCETCTDGYYFDGTSSCIQCDDPCETCSGAGSSACLTCPWGDPADANNQCILVCDEACSTCSGTTSNTCSACNDGYYFDGTTSCLPCDNSCETCSSSGPSACLTCPWGDPANVNSECVVCDAACKTCYGTDSASCYTCNDGYYFDGVSSCLQCDSSCKTCSAAGPNACLTCPSSVALNANSQCLTLKSSEFPATASTKRITDVKTTTQTVVGAGLIANTLVNTGSSGAIRFSMLAKMIQYIKYLDIDYPNDLKYAISNWDDDFINFNSDSFDITPNGLQDYESSYDPLPSTISMYDKQIDSSFLMSFWEELIPIFVLSALLISMVFFEVIVSKSLFGETAKKITRQLRICVQGLLIIYVYNDISDIVFFAILSFRTTKQATALTIINIIVSILCIIMTIGALIGQTWLVKKYQTLKIKDQDQDQFEKLQSKIEGVKVLWKDFKDDSFVKMNALVFIVLHNIIFCLILAILFEHPLAQVILINILSFTIITYLLWFRPFDEKLELIQTIICEGILFAVNICLLILMCLHSDSNSRDNVGQAILVLTMIFNFVPLGFLVVTAIIIFKKIYHAIKAYMLKRKLGQLKKPTVHIKKSQVAPSMVISIKDEVSTTMRFVGIPETTQTTSVFLGKKESVGTNLLYADTPNKTLNLFSPNPKSGPIFQFDGGSDLDDQFLKVEGNTEDSPSKFSRNSLVGSRQQLRLRSSRENWMRKKGNNETEPENVFE